MYRHIKSRQSHGKRKGEEEVTLYHFIRIATEDDFEEAREKMSGEYSNQPVVKVP